MSEHTHSFADTQWPFDLAENTGVVTTRFVMSGDASIRLIMHWPDGDWQFMCETTEDSSDGVIACLGCLFETHPVIGKFATLKRGFEAYRDSDDGDWVVQEMNIEGET